jgi:hypothetical protein
MGVKHRDIKSTNIMLASFNITSSDTSSAKESLAMIITHSTLTKTVIFSITNDIGQPVETHTVHEEALFRARGFLLY